MSIFPGRNLYVLIAIVGLIDGLWMYYEGIGVQTASLFSIVLTVAVVLVFLYVVKALASKAIVSQNLADRLSVLLQGALFMDSY
jgi:hypothetical protein